MADVQSEKYRFLDVTTPELQQKIAVINNWLLN